MQQTGFFWHVYHDKLLGWCYSHDERTAFICTDKPSNEQELHLRLFQPVRGELPQEVIETGKAYGEAWKAHDEAEKAYREALKSYGEAGKAYGEAREARVEAGQAYREVWKAYDEARKAYIEALSNHKDEIEALHAQECLNCPWDGETIFSAA